MRVRDDWTKLGWQQAESLTRCRLDRRRTYWLRHDGVVVVQENAGSEPCSGCHEWVDDHCAHRCHESGESRCRGGGCSECGYQGRVTERFFVPVQAKHRVDPPWWDPKVNITERESDRAIA